MEEKVLKAKNGMAMLMLTSLAYLLSIVVVIMGGVLLDNEIIVLGVIMLVAGILWLCIGWIPFMGLRVLKPQEALVLTLFGKYIGTLKGEGFYYVNPFVSAVNPAAKTALRQSGDVDSDGDILFDRQDR